MVSSLGGLNCLQQDLELSTHSSSSMYCQRPSRWWKEEMKEKAGAVHVLILWHQGPWWVRTYGPESGLNERKAALQNASLPSQNMKWLLLTLHFFYLHLPGYALSFKVVKVSLKFHPFLKKDKTAVSREVRRGRLLGLEGVYNARTCKHC